MQRLNHKNFASWCEQNGGEVKEIDNPAHASEKTRCEFESAEFSGYTDKTVASVVSGYDEVSGHAFEPILSVDRAVQGDNKKFGGDIPDDLNDAPLSVDFEGDTITIRGGRHWGGDKLTVNDKGQLEYIED